ncbi:uncharacterized protein LOC131289460 [Anopheles ziemanni]|uniref:uncharacterized protein LOC131289460 n=1 Tax=Anopheles ziemanni TaxID=345580 RepID=UPI00265E4576|nr:uncharacterized protein LOC131289460 [Anopheles ziemanni]
MKDFARQTMCDYYKPLLVEEIALLNNPALVHSGRCSVIGKVADNEDKLLSLAIPLFPRNLKLPDNICSVNLDFGNYHGEILRGKPVNVNGTIELAEETNHIKSLENELELKNVFNRGQKLSVIFILVESIYEVAQATEMIICNLKMRRLKQIPLKRKKKTIPPPVKS